MFVWEEWKCFRGTTLRMRVFPTIFISLSSIFSLIPCQLFAVLHFFTAALYVFQFQFAPVLLNLSIHVYILKEFT